VASRRQVREGVGIGITMQVEDITPASGPCGPLGTTGTNERWEPKGGSLASGIPAAVQTNHLQTRKMYRSKRSQESHRKRHWLGFWRQKQSSGFARAPICPASSPERFAGPWLEWRPAA
jgi:hypothetical protein